MSASYVWSISHTLPLDFPLFPFSLCKLVLCSPCKIISTGQWQSTVEVISNTWPIFSLTRMLTSVARYFNPRSKSNWRLIKGHYFFVWKNLEHGNPAPKDLSHISYNIVYDTKSKPWFQWFFHFHLSNLKWELTETICSRVQLWLRKWRICPRNQQSQSFRFVTLLHHD